MGFAENLEQSNWARFLNRPVTEGRAEERRSWGNRGEFQIWGAVTAAHTKENI